MSVSSNSLTSSTTPAHFAMLAAVCDKEREELNTPTDVFVDADVIIDALDLARSIREYSRRHDTPEPLRRDILTSRLSEPRYTAAALWMACMAFRAKVLPPHLAEINAVVTNDQLRRGKAGAVEKDRHELARLLSGLKGGTSRDSSEKDNLELLRDWLIPSNFVLFQALFGIGPGGKRAVSDIVEPALEEYTRCFGDPRNSFSDPHVLRVWSSMLTVHKETEEYSIDDDFAPRTKKSFFLERLFSTGHTRRDRLAANSLSDAAALVTVAKLMSEKVEPGSNSNRLYRFFTYTRAAHECVSRPAIRDWWRSTARDQVQGPCSDSVSDLPLDLFPELDHPFGPLRSPAYLALRCLLPSLRFSQVSTKIQLSAPDGLGERDFPLAKWRDAARCFILGVHKYGSVTADDRKYLSGLFVDRRQAEWWVRAYAEMWPQFATAVLERKALIEQEASSAGVRFVSAVREPLPLTHDRGNDVRKADSAASASGDDTSSSQIGLSILTEICRRNRGAMSDVKEYDYSLLVTPTKLPDSIYSSSEVFCNALGFSRWMIERDKSKMRERRSLFQHKWKNIIDQKLFPISDLNDPGDLGLATMSAAFAFRHAPAMNFVKETLVQHTVGSLDSEHDCQQWSRRCLYASIQAIAGELSSAEAKGLIEQAENAIVHREKHPASRSLVVGVCWSVFYGAFHGQVQIDKTGPRYLGELNELATEWIDIVTNARRVFDLCWYDTSPVDRSYPAVRWLLASLHARWPHKKMQFWMNKTEDIDPSSINAATVQRCPTMLRQAIAVCAWARVINHPTEDASRKLADDCKKYLNIDYNDVGSREEYWLLQKQWVERFLAKRTSKAAEE